MNLSRRTFLISAAVVAAAGLSATAAVHTDSVRVWRAGGRQLGLDIFEDGRYEVTVFGRVWLSGSGCALHSNQRWFASDRFGSNSAPLKKVATKSTTGSDALGDFRGLSISWDADGTPFVTTFKFYRAIPCIVFEQSFPKGAQKLASKSPVMYDTQWNEEAFMPAINDCGIASAFPSFDLASLPEVKHLTFKGCFAYPSLGHKLDTFTGGLESGVPLVLFDQQRNTAVLSPLNHFMNAVQIKAAPLADHLTCGLSGEIEAVPPGFTQQFVLHAGNGINKTVFDWGALLMKASGKQPSVDGDDVFRRYVTYWPDNGADPYYNPLPGKTLTETMVAFAADWQARGIPIRGMELDSFLYNRGPGKEPVSWNPRLEVVPPGMSVDEAVRWVHEQTGLPLARQNRYWSRINDYQAKYPFVIGEAASLPTSEEFWRDLFKKQRESGVVLYEQDFLNRSLERIHQLRTDPLLGEQWLGKLHSGAAAVDMNVMWCMPLPSEVLMASMFNVRQIRASTDYNPGSDQWRIGKTSMLMHAVGTVPAKDVFRSSLKEPKSPMYSGYLEPNFELEALVSTWSCGMVASGDAFGLENKDLLLKTCRADGLILKPDRPATAIDQSYIDDAVTGELWDTFTRIDGKQWHYLLCADQKQKVSISPSEPGLDGAYVVLDLASGQLTPVVSKFGERGVDISLEVGGTQPSEPGAVPLQYFVFAPADSDGFAFLGETNKFTAVSRQRFSEIHDFGAEVAVQGVPGETVNLEWHMPQAPKQVTVNGTSVPFQHEQNRLKLTVALGETGNARIKISR